jgi:sterol desaturase/sphingolipid hydroxylase (fatty acid hydroxylase superfamily)
MNRQKYKNYINESKLFKKYPILKNRSVKSREKIADSFMSLSDKLWSSIFVSIITLSLAGIFKVIFIPSNIVSIEKLLINTSYFWALIIVLTFGTVLAFYFRKYALDIYDSL